ncbi:MAG: hypothetical protein MJ070_10295 [Lachnospiraceae bacterium]|nr:hypothetical protein [Lachnospiraceae bacterium]
MAFFLAMVLAFSVFGLLWSNGFLENKRENTEPSEPKAELVIDRVRFEEYFSNYKLKGIVRNKTSPELTKMALPFSAINEEKIKTLLGKDYSVGETVLSSAEGDDFVIDFNGKLVDYSYDSDVSGEWLLFFLNYDSLLIETEIDESHYEKIGYDSVVKVKKGKKSFSSAIHRIGYEVNHGVIGLTVDLPVQMLPGTEVDIDVFSSFSKKALWVDADFIIWDGSSYYVFKVIDENDGLFVKIPVTVGEVSELTDPNGTVSILYEICSGLVEGDIICIEQR